MKTAIKHYLTNMHTVALLLFLASFNTWDSSAMIRCQKYFSIGACTSPVRRISDSRNAWALLAMFDPHPRQTMHDDGFNCMHGGPEYSSSSLTSFQTTVGYLQVQPSFNASAFAFLLAMRNSEASVSECCSGGGWWLVVAKECVVSQIQCRQQWTIKFYFVPYVVTTKSKGPISSGCCW